MVRLNKNMGLAYALNYGLELCTHDWVFRMDVDDVCAKDRFSKQIEIISLNPDIDILEGIFYVLNHFLTFFRQRSAS